MTNNEYLRSVVDNNRQAAVYSSTATNVFENLKQVISSNFLSIIGVANWSQVALVIQQSGSRAKGTAIKGKSDIDIFLSISDPTNFRTLEQYYNAIFTFVNGRYSKVRKQNVSIGLDYSGFDVDIVPAKRVNSSGWERHNDHYLWSTKKQVRMQTNIQKHIDTVRLSNCQDEIILAKRWRKKSGIDISSIYLELLVIDAIKGRKTFSLENDFTTVLAYIRDNICTRRVIDPANSNNVISDTLSATEKVTIQRLAQKAIEARSWSDVV